MSSPEPGVRGRSLRVIALGALLLAGCQDPSAGTYRAGPCGATYFVGGTVSDPGYYGSYGGGYGYGGGVWYDPGDGWVPGDDAPPPDDGSYDPNYDPSTGGYDCASDPSCSGSSDPGGNPSTGGDPSYGGDPNAGGGDTSGSGDPSTGGDTSGGDTSGGDTSGGDTGGDTSLHHKLHLVAGGAGVQGGGTTTQSLRPQGVPAACYSCTMICQTADGATGRVATGASDVSNEAACGAAVHQLELWAHHDIGARIGGCAPYSTDGSGGSTTQAPPTGHVAASPTAQPAAQPAPQPSAGAPYHKTLPGPTTYTAGG